jgi:hypothetical protein
MTDRQRRISGLAFVAGLLAGLVLIGVGYGARAAAAPPAAGAPADIAASVAQRSR